MGRASEEMDRRESPRDPDINSPRQAKKRNQPELRRKLGSNMTIYLPFVNSGNAVSIVLGMEATFRRGLKEIRG